MKYLNLLFLLALCTVGYAQSSQDSSKRSYNLFHPVPENLMRSFETDRPELTESPYTVDAGHFQYEADLFKTERFRRRGEKNIENSYHVANFKLGITNSLDVQFIIASFVRTKFTGENFTTRISGVGNAAIRVKQNVFGDDKGKVSLAILPFINIPSKAFDDGISGGLIIPFSLSLSGNWNVGSQIESDLVKNQLKKGHHQNFLISMTTTHPLFNKCIFFLEAVVSRDNEMKSNEYFADAGIVYRLKEYLNLDTGFYYGIKSSSPKTWFLGASFRL